jgi:hypothetical protein
MIVYGHHPVRLDIAEFLRSFSHRLDRLPATPAHDAVVDLLVDFGEAYVAVADELFPLRDDDPEAIAPWSAAAQALATALAASWHRETVLLQRAIASSRRHARALASTSIIGHVSGRTAEGFAHWGVYPEQYLLAAERFVAAHAPRTITCIGIRTIGAPLAHVVAAAAERRGVAARVFTVRPRGHPFDRRITLTERLRCHLLHSPNDCFAIVDEGPGLSGSSFAAVSDTLVDLGIDATRIVLFPSWLPPEGGLRAPRGRAAMQRHLKMPATFDEVYPSSLEDLSGGAWRTRVFGEHQRRWPAVHPQHERRKYFSAGHVLRFAGLGGYGRAKFQRAAALAEGGFSSRPLTLSGGFLAQDWIDGAPLIGQRTSPATIDRIADYLAFLGRTFRTGRRASVDDLTEMMNVNLNESVGREALPLVDALAADAKHFDEPQVAVDGRMLPYEWIAGRSGRLIKTDALDHHADDFFPASRDVAWDVAGTIVEFDLGPDATSYLIAAYGSRSKDHTIARRIGFYHSAYLTYRLGYVTMAAETLGDTPDGRRFTAIQTRHRRSLEVLSRDRHGARSG